MFHLQAGIHFQKVESVGVLIENEFHCAGIAVMHRLHKRTCSIVQFMANMIGQVGGRCFFQHFLVATLGGTVAFTEGNGLAFAITEYLDFNVTGASDIFFYKDAIIGKIVGAEAAHAIPSLV